MIEYERSHDTFRRSSYEKKAAIYLEDDYLSPKTMMLSYIEAIEATKLKDKAQRPTNIMVYEFYLGVIDLISKGKLFYLDYFLLMRSSKADQEWLQDNFDNCFHIVACSMRKSFGIIGEINHKNVYVNSKDSDEGVINDVSNYYTGKISADKGL